jgi:hypothetical protein
VIGWICAVVAPVRAQHIDVAIAGGSLYSSGSSFNAGTFLPGGGGGAFIGFNGDVLIRGNLGVQAEVNWRQAGVCTVAKFLTGPRTMPSMLSMPVGLAATLVPKRWPESERKAFGSTKMATAAIFTGTVSTM